MSCSRAARACQVLWTISACDRQACLAAWIGRAGCTRHDGTPARTRRRQRRHAHATRPAPGRPRPPPLSLSTDARPVAPFPSWRHLDAAQPDTPRFRSCTHGVSPAASARQAAQRLGWRWRRRAASEQSGGRRRHAGASSAAGAAAGWSPGRRLTDTLTSYAGHGALRTPPGYSPAAHGTQAARRARSARGRNRHAAHTPCPRGAYWRHRALAR